MNSLFFRSFFVFEILQATDFRAYTNAWVTTHNPPAHSRNKDGVSDTCDVLAFTKLSCGNLVEILHPPVLARVRRL